MIDSRVIRDKLTFYYRLPSTASSLTIMRGTSRACSLVVIMPFEETGIVSGSRWRAVGVLSLSL